MFLDRSWTGTLCLTAMLATGTCHLARGAITSAEMCLFHAVVERRLS